MMIRLILDSEEFTDWEVDSSSSDETYIVSVDDEGNVFCSCLDFYYRKSKLRTHISNPDCFCKHLRQVIENGEIKRSKKYRQICQAASC